MGNKRAWLKLYVKSLDSAVWQNKTLWRVWSWALLRANHFPTKTTIDGREIPIAPGSFVSGRFTGSAECGLRPSTFWKAIVTLRKMGNLDTKSNNRFSTITVRNWAIYQARDYEAAESVTAELTPENDSERNNKVTTNEQQSDTVETKDYRLRDISPAGRIYEHYKRVVKSGAAFDAKRNIEKLLKDGHTEEELRSTIDRYAGNGMSKDKQFRIQANNFFGQKGRFRDFLAENMEGQDTFEQDIPKHLASEIAYRFPDLKEAFTAKPGGEIFHYKGPKDVWALCRELHLTRGGVEA